MLPGLAAWLGRAVPGGQPCRGHRAGTPRFPARLRPRPSVCLSDCLSDCLPGRPSHMVCLSRPLLGLSITAPLPKERKKTRSPAGGIEPTTVMTP